MTRWKCIQCGATPQKHGRGGEDACISVGECEGLLCECFEYGDDAIGSDEKDHGTSYSNPCKHAACHHCGWGGVMPPPLVGLQAWERKALDAGWTMPAARKAEVEAAEKAKGKKR